MAVVNIKGQGLQFAMSKHWRKPLYFMGPNHPVADSECDSRTVIGDRWELGDWHLVAVDCADGVLRWRLVKFLD